MLVVRAVLDDTSSNDRQHLRGNRWNLLDEVTECSTVKMQCLHVGLCRHRCIATGMGENGHLASKPARTDVGYVLSGAGDFKGSINDNNHFVGA